jgi:hypothetical protein
MSRKILPSSGRHFVSQELIGDIGENIGADVLRVAVFGSACANLKINLRVRQVKLISAVTMKSLRT